MLYLFSVLLLVCGLVLVVLNTKVASFLLLLLLAPLFPTSLCLSVCPPHTTQETSRLPSTPLLPLAPHR